MQHIFPLRLWINPRAQLWIVILTIWQTHYRIRALLRASSILPIEYPTCQYVDGTLPGPRQAFRFHGMHFCSGLSMMRTVARSVVCNRKATCFHVQSSWTRSVLVSCVSGFLCWSGRSWCILSWCCAPLLGFHQERDTTPGCWSASSSDPADGMADPADRWSKDRRCVPLA